MAINKRKILQSAQKHLQKGALEKALKDYQTLLKADPRDANLRLKIGDIELKRGRPDEAVTAYMKVAEAFMKDGFDAKAVALYKQITKIDEKRADVLVPLADLYQRMGLQSDAMAALQTAADAHYRDGNKDDALDLLRRMAALDPSNTNSRLKVADLLRQEERNDEAISEYEEVAAELDRQGAEEDRIRVLVRVLELAPDRVDLLASVARSRIDSGNFEAAEKTANLMIEQQPDDPDAWLLLGESRDGLGRGSESVDAYRRAAEIHRERGNDDVARDITQRCVAPATVGWVQRQEHRISTRTECP
ncbi:MAG: tetratricopeptide repeat protein [Deltaproteobacteria bacterium]|nr:tetratricopeptide repeat protein [Deltaproteobacteria bacterium]